MAPTLKKIYLYTNLILCIYLYTKLVKEKKHNLLIYHRFEKSDRIKNKIIFIILETQYKQNIYLKVNIKFEYLLG